MGIASASFTVTIRGHDPLDLMESLLPFLSHRFLQTKSGEIHLPGRKYMKIKDSIDGDLFWGKHELPAQLQGEKVIEDIGFTILENPDHWLQIPRDLSQIIGSLREYCEESGHLWKTKATKDDDVFFAFWGLCRVVHAHKDAPPEDSYFLRQKLIRAQRLEPIVRITSHLVHHPRPELIMRIFTRSFVWSHYTSEFDTVKQEWIRKPQSQVEKDNARSLAETVRSFLAQFPNAEVEWEHEQQHSPDLRGFLPAEFTACLGAPNTPRRVRDPQG